MTQVVLPSCQRVPELVHKRSVHRVVPTIFCENLKCLKPLHRFLMFTRMARQSKQKEAITSMIDLGNKPIGTRWLSMGPRVWNLR